MTKFLFHKNGYKFDKNTPSLLLPIIIIIIYLFHTFPKWSSCKSKARWL
jgi:hypothetical protein